MNFALNRLSLLNTLCLSIALAGCGGGDGSSTTDAAPDAGSAVSGELEVTRTVSGRVADGYISGATVCVDLNENEECDADEPHAVTGTGGRYQLDVPDGADDKPIVADIPEDAIDEDTGEQVGKRLVLVAPGDRPEFVSPLTTLIHEELKQNPALDVFGAEAAVKSELGLDGDGVVSLFTDYVESGRNSNGTDSDDADEFRYLHQTARVVARLMQDIQGDVEAAAVVEGVELAADAETRQAVRQLVRSEVKNLLPQIARDVANLIQENASSAEPVEVADLDPIEIANDLRPTDAIENLDEQILAIKERTEIERTSMKDLLADGVYWIDLDCDRADDIAPVRQEGGIDEPLVDDVNIVLNDEGIPEEVYLQERCEAEYGVVRVSADSDELQEQTFVYDEETDMWTDRDRGQSDRVFAYALVDGQWTPLRDSDDVGGTVEYTDNGGAVITNARGKTVIQASSRLVESTPIAQHIRERGAEPQFIALAEDSGVFPAGARVHKLSIRNESHAYVLPHWEGEEEGDCTEFNGNCNIVNGFNAANPGPLMTLPVITDEIAEGVKLAGLLYDDFANRPLDATLKANGTVHWMTAPDDHGTQPAPGEQPEHGQMPEHGEVPECRDADGPDAVPTDGTQTDLPPEPQVQLDAVEVDPCLPPPDCIDQAPMPANVQNDACPEPVPGIDPAVVDPEQEQGTSIGNGTDQPQYDEAVVTENLSEESTGERLADITGVWKYVTVDDVKMIKIAVPWELRHRIGHDDAESILLVEQNGYVRRGLHIADDDFEGEIAYNVESFGALEPVIKLYVSSE